MDELAAAYERHASRCDETDFWGQVRRTVNGQAVPEEQIHLIIEAMVAALDLREDDVLLDICCGNGALSARFFERCAGGLGIDYSPTLIGVARKHFDVGPSVAYETGEAVAYATNAPDPGRFTKAIVYGSISYFPRAATEALFAALRQRFTSLSRLVIGNVADLAHIREFFGDRYEPGIEDRPDSAIGVWWSREEFAAMAARAGWSVAYQRMPEAFYASHYRFDAILKPV